MMDPLVHCRQETSVELRVTTHYGQNVLPPHSPPVFATVDLIFVFRWLYCDRQPHHAA